MLSTADQIHGDAALKHPLLALRNYVASVGRTGELDAFLAAWDEAIVSLDFQPVAAKFPIFTMMLLGVTDDGPLSRDVQKRTWIDDDLEMMRLLRRAVGRESLYDLSEEDADFLEEICAELAGLLEDLLRFAEPSSYLSVAKAPAWATEHVSAEEINRPNPIELYDFVFEVEGFVTNFMTSKWNWRRHIGR